MRQGLAGQYRPTPASVNDNGIELVEIDGQGRLIIVADTSGLLIKPRTSAVLDFNTETGIGVGVETTINSITAGASDLSLTQIICTGPTTAIWRVYIDAELVLEQRSNPQGMHTFDFQGSPYPLLSGEAIDVTVEHCRTGKILDFKSAIRGY